MSTDLNSTSQRPYPLSPPPHRESTKQQAANYQQPQTPQSPLRPTSSSVEPTPTSFTMSNPETSSSLPLQERSFATTGSVTSTEQNEPLSTQHDDLSNKRKRELGDNGDREQKKIHVEERRLGIEDLHLDVGEKYLLCRTPHPKIQPDLSQDLFEMYGLNGIAAKVARVLPTGEKNALRKTYKGKIKELGLSGKFDVVVKDEDAPSGLLAMIREPELEWTVTNRQGKEVEHGFSANVRANLGAALTMAKGTIPKSSWDSSVLGELDIPEHKAPTQNAKASLGASASRSGANTPMPNIPRTSKGELARPKRNIKKRGYDDSTFEGYGEGFVDDDLNDGYSTGEGEGSSKRRKKTSTSHVYPGPMRHNSYGPGMVGA